MTAFASLNGNRLTTVALCMPLYGTWSADVVLAESTMITTAVTLAIGDLSLVGSVYRQANFAGSRSARLIGGAGGWRKGLSRKPYANPAGLRRSMVIGDAAREVGEAVTLDADGTIGTFFVREAAPASRVLRQLAGALWWVDPAGMTHIGPRPTGAISSDFTVIHWSGKTGSFEIATDNYADWMPGKTFTAPTVSGTQTVSLVNLNQDNEGKLRLEVLASGGTT
jgi:hypothetical protein